jgi:hypothetical protein
VSTDAFAALTHHAAAAVSRRRSLLTLGGAALASGLTTPRGGEAKKSAAKKARKKCKRQSEQCRTFYQELCEENDCDEEAVEEILQCCAGFKTCNAGAFLDCLFAPSMV